MFSDRGKKETKNVQRKETKNTAGRRRSQRRVLEEGTVELLLKDKDIWAWGGGEEHSRWRAQAVESENRSGGEGIGECLKGSGGREGWDQTADLKCLAERLQCCPEALGSHGRAARW